MTADTMLLSFLAFLELPQLVQGRYDDYMTLLAKLTSQRWLYDTLTDLQFIL